MNIEEFRKKIIREIDGFMNSYFIHQFYLDTDMNYNEWLDLFNEYLEEGE